MWQRLQTLYLAIALGLIISMFFCNCAFVLNEQGAKEGILFIEKTPYLIFLVMTAIAGGFSLFTFKWRCLQMRIAVIQALILLGFQIWIIVDFIALRGGLIFTVPAVFPVVAAILSILGAKNIMLDEAMVQSAYRIRNSRRKRK